MFATIKFPPFKTLILISLCHWEKKTNYSTSFSFSGKKIVTVLYMCKLKTALSNPKPYTARWDSLIVFQTVNIKIRLHKTCHMILDLLCPIRRIFFPKAEFEGFSFSTNIAKVTKKWAAQTCRQFQNFSGRSAVNTTDRRRCLLEGTPQLFPLIGD